MLVFVQSRKEEDPQLSFVDSWVMAWGNHHCQRVYKIQQRINAQHHRDDYGIWIGTKEEFSKLAMCTMERQLSGDIWETTIMSPPRLENNPDAAIEDDYAGKILSLGAYMLMCLGITYMAFDGNSNSCIIYTEVILLCNKLHS